MWLKSAPLAAQMLVTLVGSIVATAAALTTVAYHTVAHDLEQEAMARVRIAAASRADALNRIVNAQRDRAERFLVTTGSLCGERRADGGIAWEDGCSRRALQEFRITERAHGAVLLSNDRPVAVAGARRVNGSTRLAPLGLATLVTDVDGADYYVIQAASRNSSLVLEYPLTDQWPLFGDHPALADGEVFLRHVSGTFLTPARHGQPRTPAGARVTEAAHPCSDEPSSWRGLDYRGIDTLHSLQPVAAFYGACAEAHLALAAAVQPAIALRNTLYLRGGLLAGLGVLLALMASSWLARPVLRLAADACALQDGDFARPIRIEGPSEVAELGRSLGTMARALVEMISRERRARQDAEDANKAKDEFLAVLSHELRTPLTVTLGWARLLRAGHLDPQRAARAVDAIERATVTQTHLVNDLLDVSRIIAGRLQLERRVLACARPVRAAIEQIRAVAERKGVELAVQAPDELLVTGDATRLQQVVSNLLTNALKFTAPGGRVDVTLTARDAHAELAVRDTGEGIAPDVLPFIFDRFRQADGGPTRRHGGLGLGLAIVRHLVTLHGGSVQALSAGPGRGATFIVQLPLAPAGAVATPVDDTPTSADQATGRARLEGVRLLLVDDDEATRQVVQALLEDVGATVVAARSADEARGLVEPARPDVIVSDVAMPGEDGYQFLRTIRERGVIVPAVALTAGARREDADHALAAGFQLHLPKPVERGALIAAVSSLAATELGTPTA
jgi:signal transduction histidine kinase/CheY-like chemotaxis protein